MMPDRSDLSISLAELRLRDAKIELFHCLCCKDKSKLTAIEVEIGFWLVQDRAIQDRLEQARIQEFKAGLRSTKPCHCDKAWGENEPCPRHGWEAGKKTPCACKSKDSRECAIIRYGIREDYLCECTCHDQRIGYDDEES